MWFRFSPSGTLTLHPTICSLMYLQRTIYCTYVSALKTLCIKQTGKKLIIYESLVCDTFEQTITGCFDLQVYIFLRTSWSVGSFFRLVNVLIPPPLCSALVSPTHIAKGWKFCTLQPFCREHEYLFIVCICPLSLLPLSLSVCQTFHFLSFLFHLPLHCYLAFSFARVYICTYHILYRTSRYDIRPSVNMEFLSSFVSGWERLMNVCGQSWGLFVIIHMQVLKSTLS